MTADDQEMAEMMMSLSGTFIVTSNEEESGINNLPSIVTSRALVKALLMGGEAEIYRCDEKEKCLNPTKSTVTITEEQGLVSQVRSMIGELNTKMISDDEGLSNKTKGFLEMTPLPIMKNISTDLSLGKAINPAEYSDIIAVTLLNQYLSAGIKLVQQAVAATDTVLSQDMKDQADKAQVLISDKTADSYRKLANTHLFSDNSKANERRLVSRLSNLVSVGQNTK
jgi:conjugative transfer pilus assembly protein TraH